MELAGVRDGGSSDRSVDVLVSRLRRKLEEGFDTPVLETVWGTGYRLIARADPARG